MNQEITYLLDQSKPFDQAKVQILDKVTDAMYGSNQQFCSFNDANSVLQKLKENSDFWMQSDLILEYSQKTQTKQIILIILEEQIKLKWKMLNQQQQSGIRQYMMNLIIRLGQMQNKSNEANSLLSRANSIIVQIVKYEWTTTWKDFISQICAASKSDQNLCENNLQILKILSEEIFEHSKNSLTSKQIVELKNNFAHDFKQIFDLCFMISHQFIQNPQNIKLQLMKSCLETLHSFLSWIPLYYIFELDIIETVFLPLINNPQFCIITINCLTEICSIKIEQVTQLGVQKIQEKMLNLYKNFIRGFENIIPSGTNLELEYQNLQKSKDKKKTQQFEEICRSASLFITTYFSVHNDWVEPLIENFQGEVHQFLDAIQKGLQYIIEFQKLPDDQIFKICIEFWQEFVSKLAKSGQQQTNQPLLFINNQQPNLKQNLYPQILNHVRRIMVCKMAKPEEVLISTDEGGNAIKVVVENTENNNLFETMKDLMINLAKINWENTKQVIDERMQSIMDNSCFSYENLNALSWCCGSISGNLPDDEEKIFFIKTLKNLLNLVESKKGKEAKATIASNIMYLVGQFPKFMQQNHSFLQTVCRKLFEFMKESFPGVMNMAVNTFLKISIVSRHEFIYGTSKHEDQNSFFQDIIRNIQDHISLLDEKDKLIFYEAIGNIINADKNPQNQIKYVNDVLQPLNNVFFQIFSIASQQGDKVLFDEINVNQIIYFIKVNERLSQTIKEQYYDQFQKIFGNLQDLYKFYSIKINDDCNANGLVILNHYYIKKMRQIKRATLTLFQTFVSNSNPQNSYQFIQQFIQILNDYNSNVPEVREPEVISLFTIIIQVLNVQLQSNIQDIFQLLFNSTLPMITRDFNSYPDHRLNFFAFLKAVIKHAFIGKYIQILHNNLIVLFSCPNEQFKTMFNCVMWAIKHELPSIFDIGLDVLLTILQNLNQQQQIANQFYQQYYMTILMDILFVLTDSFHKNGFKQQAQILQILFQVLDPVFLQNQLTENQQISNQNLIYQQVVQSLCQLYTNVSRQQTESYVQQLMQQCQQEKEFKVTLRDYLIQLDHFSNEDLIEKQQ